LVCLYSENIYTSLFKPHQYVSHHNRFAGPGLIKQHGYILVGVPIFQKPRYYLWDNRPFDMYICIANCMLVLGKQGPTSS
jgi:hypothetical protein